MQLSLDIPTTARSNQVKSIPSLIKWTGSKRSSARPIYQIFPSYRRYCEPFVGGGALLYLAAHRGALAGDLYAPLIELWRLIQQQPQAVVSTYRAQWDALQAELDSVNVHDMSKGNGVPRLYYQIRDRFNEQPNGWDLNFLMRTCVNGIVRFNDNGEFNNSFHLSRRGMHPDRFASVVHKWHSVLKGVDFRCQDYQETLAMLEAGDFVYLDPPYAGNKQRYTENLNVENFFSALGDLNRRGVKWALSFDGRRGATDLQYDVPGDLYKDHRFVFSGTSAVHKVLNGPVERVEESLYLNYYPERTS